MRPESHLDRLGGFRGLVFPSLRCNQPLPSGGQPPRSEEGPELRSSCGLMSGLSQQLRLASYPQPTASPCPSRSRPLALKMSLLLGFLCALGQGWGSGPLLWEATAEGPPGSEEGSPRATDSPLSACRRLTDGPVSSFFLAGRKASPWQSESGLDPGLCRHPSPRHQREWEMFVV